MPPKQNDQPNSVPENYSSAAAEPARTVGKVIQPVSSDFIEEQNKLSAADSVPPTSAPPPNVEPPQQAAEPASESSVAPPDQDAAPSLPSAVYPEPQTPQYSPTVQSNFYSQKEAESSNKKHRKKNILLASLIILALSILGAGGGYYYWYKHQDHSVFAKLTIENYDQDGIRFSFEYPRVMTTYGNALTVSENKSAYEYVSSDGKIVIALAALTDNEILQHFGLTPAQELGQIQSGSGNYIDTIRSAAKKSNKLEDFNALYGGCKNKLTLKNGQASILCVNDSVIGGTDVTDARVIAADNNYQYVLSIAMAKNLWQNHQKVWQKVEKSLTY